MSEKIRAHCRRTSQWEGKPCPEAFQVMLSWQDRRTVNSIEKALASHWGKQWYESGTNHRVEYGMVVCDRPEQAEWVVEFGSLDELMKFIEKHGDVVLGPCSDYKGIEWKIEIYDTYRE